MDASREEYPRISVDSYHDWQRIKADFTQAAFVKLEEHLKSSDAEVEREALSIHLQRVINTLYDSSFR